MQADLSLLLQNTDWDKLWKVAVTVLCGFLTVVGVLYVTASYIKHVAVWTFKAVVVFFAIIGILSSSSQLKESGILDIAHWCIAQYHRYGELLLVK